MQAGFQVQHTIPLHPPELCPVPPRIIELVLVLSHPFVDWDNVLTNLVGLPGLDTWDQEQQCNTLRLLPWKNQANYSLGHQFVQVYVQPGFLLWMQVGWLCLDGHGVGEVQTVVVLWVPNPPDICLDGHKLVVRFCFSWFYT